MVHLIHNRECITHSTVKKHLRNYFFLSYTGLPLDHQRTMSSHESSNLCWEAKRTERVRGKEWKKEKNNGCIGKKEKVAGVTAYFIDFSSPAGQSMAVLYELTHEVTCFSDFSYPLHISDPTLDRNPSSWITVMLAGSTQSFFFSFLSSPEDSSKSSRQRRGVGGGGHNGIDSKEKNPSESRSNPRIAVDLCQNKCLESPGSHTSWNMF